MLPIKDSESPREAVRRLQSAVGRHPYNPRGSTYNVDKDRPVPMILATGAAIHRDLRAIQCVEAVFLALWLSNGWRYLHRFGLSFRTIDREGRLRRHLVLGLYVDGSTCRFGAVGLSRSRLLMGRPLVFANLRDLVGAYAAAYLKEGHALRGVSLGRPVPHSITSPAVMINWDQISMQTTATADCWHKGCNLFQAALQAASRETDREWELWQLCSEFWAAKGSSLGKASELRELFEVTPTGRSSLRQKSLDAIRTGSSPAVRRCRSAGLSSSSPSSVSSSRARNRVRKHRSMTPVSTSNNRSGAVNSMEMERSTCTDLSPDKGDPLSPCSNSLLSDSVLLEISDAQGNEETYAHQPLAQLAVVCWTQLLAASIAAAACVASTTATPEEHHHGSRTEVPLPTASRWSCMTNPEDSSRTAAVPNDCWVTFAASAAASSCAAAVSAALLGLELPDVLRRHCLTFSEARPRTGDLPIDVGAAIAVAVAVAATAGTIASTSSTASRCTAFFGGTSAHSVPPVSPRLQSTVLTPHFSSFTGPESGSALDSDGSAATEDEMHGMQPTLVVVAQRGLWARWWMCRCQPRILLCLCACVMLGILACALTALALI
eukprot:NODE_732_length_1942_cov_29.005283_g678_i0.p1 GENE.NODE_732_length_1942_cov_29.005283_g678_i0~~NODE_732_length_1942_cov_29.005283_g678_i0.p1  ORF type:complete len:605 (+),score=71.73 NODE_732_length_1942_cov_29.005283_g678_i0:103-1917(+)